MTCHMFFNRETIRFAAKYSYDNLTIIQKIKYFMKINEETEYFSIRKTQLTPTMPELQKYCMK